MTFHKIDMQAWERKKRYEHYTEAVPCTYSMTVALDVTKLLCGVREKGLPFFPVVLYGLAREVNRHAEFRMAQDEMGNVGYYSHCDPCYTVFHKETESFTEVWTAYDASPAVFLARYREDMARYRNAPELSKPPAGKNLFNVSCIPWSSFTGFNLNLQNGYWKIFFRWRENAPAAGCAGTPCGVRRIPSFTVYERASDMDGRFSAGARTGDRTAAREAAALSGASRAALSVPDKLFVQVTLPENPGRNRPSKPRPRTKREPRRFLQGFHTRFRWWQFGRPFGPAPHGRGPCAACRGRWAARAGFGFPCWFGFAF